MVKAKSTFTGTDLRSSTSPCRTKKALPTLHLFYDIVLVTGTHVHVTYMCKGGGYILL